MLGWWRRTALCEQEASECYTNVKAGGKVLRLSLCWGMLSPGWAFSSHFAIKRGSSSRVLGDYRSQEEQSIKGYSEELFLSVDCSARPGRMGEHVDLEGRWIE